MCDIARTIASAVLRRALVIAFALCALSPAHAFAQAAVLDLPPGQIFTSLTPLLRARALSFPRQFQFQYRLTASTSPESPIPAIIDTIVVTTDTIVDIQLTRPLPSEAVLYFRLTVVPASGTTVDAPIQGPRQVPRWLTLITPNGGLVGTRRPLFAWRSAPVTPLIGPWRYDIEILTNGRSAAAAAGITDTTFIPNNDLETNASYIWNVRAYLPRGESIRQISVSTFLVADPTEPTTTLFYQNFPNPFPSASAFATCFWFDIAQPGGRVTLDILDLRGNLVRSIIPGASGQQAFDAGRYGRGAVGAGTNCDGRFVWDATGNDGRSVPAGLYLAKFSVAGGAPVFKRIYFRGR